MPATLDRCPRCLRSFHCGFADAEGCACFTISLDEALLRDLRRAFRGCLCLRCLRELASQPWQGLPRDGSPLTSPKIGPATTGPSPKE